MLGNKRTRKAGEAAPPMSGAGGDPGRATGGSDDETSKKTRVTVEGYEPVTGAAGSSSKAEHHA